MNRVIKFRAWNGERMLFTDKNQFYLNGEQVDIPSQTGHEFYRKDYAIMQFTGLTDKNRKEIYEGDILLMYRHSDFTHKHERGQVWGQDGKYHDDVRQVKWESGTFYTDSQYGIKISFMHMARPGESFEVIGNIFENPDLIN